MPITSLCHFFKITNEYLVDLYYKYDIIKIGFEKNWIFKNHTYLLKKAYEKGYIK